jgi:hypothetical protein
LVLVTDGGLQSVESLLDVRALEEEVVEVKVEVLEDPPRGRPMYGPAGDTVADDDDQDDDHVEQAEKPQRGGGDHELPGHRAHRIHAAARVR